MTAVGNMLVLKAITDNPDTGVSYFISWNNADKILASLYFSDGAPVELVGTSVHEFADPGADPAEPFVHVALTYDGTTVTLYVNGAAEVSEDAPGRSIAYGPGSVVVGAIHDVHRKNYPRSPDGIIDELEIFDYALTDGQIKDIYETRGACKVTPSAPPVLDVVVDVKPGSDDNLINLDAGRGKSAKSEKSTKGKKSGHDNANIPVAILTTDEFDAATVDVSSVMLGVRDNGTVGVMVKNNGDYQAALEDVDEDGDLDLVVHFLRDTLIEYGGLTVDTTELCVSGVLEDVTPEIHIYGCDAVHVVVK